MLVTATDLQDVLTAARRLPRQAQEELVETLLREGHVVAGPAGQPELELLRGMSQTELRALANAVLASRHQRRMSALLRKNRQSKLSEQERKELDSLLEESDRVALLKARAAYTLMRLSEASTAAA
jgi:hypothetical protein